MWLGLAGKNNKAWIWCRKQRRKRVFSQLGWFDYLAIKCCSMSLSLWKLIASDCYLLGFTANIEDSPPMNEWKRKKVYIVFPWLDEWMYTHTDRLCTWLFFFCFGSTLCWYRCCMASLLRSYGCMYGVARLYTVVGPNWNPHMIRIWMWNKRVLKPYFLKFPLTLT